MEHNVPEASTQGLKRTFQAKYIAEAAGLSETEKVIYGEEGEYYALSKKCFKYISPTYVYELCPYHKVTQDDGQKAEPVKLGKDGVLDLSDKSKPKVIFSFLSFHKFVHSFFSRTVIDSSDFIFAL